MRWFERKPNIAEVTQYTEDLRHMIVLRAKAESVEETERYDRIIEGMQRVLIHLTKGHK